MGACVRRRRGHYKDLDTGKVQCLVQVREGVRHAHPFCLGRRPVWVATDEAEHCDAGATERSHMRDDSVRRADDDGPETALESHIRPHGGLSGRTYWRGTHPLVPLVRSSPMSSMLRANTS